MNVPCGQGLVLPRVFIALFLGTACVDGLLCMDGLSCTRATVNSWCFHGLCFGYVYSYRWLVMVGAWPCCMVLLSHCGTGLCGGLGLCEATQ